MRQSSFATSVALFLVCTSLKAYDVNDTVSINGVIAGAVQCQNVSNAPGTDSGCRGALPIQPELSIRPTDFDEFLFKLGFAAGNGLNEVSPFVIRPWAADLEDDVKNINGRNRNYLLTAWYRHEFSIGEDHSLEASIGIIDSNDYLDDNAFASDEYAQFMNAALGSGRNFLLPSYDVGAALAWQAGRWSVHGVYMNVGENDDGNNFNFAGAKVGYRADTPLGEGNYRVVIDGTSKAFLDPTGTLAENRVGLLLSFDQQLGQTVGAFLRVGWQDDQAAVNYEGFYTGGIDINGSVWGRADDNIGIGFAYLDGGNRSVDQTYIAETYYRMAVSKYFAVTADLQYMKDDNRVGSDPEGLIFGIRLAAEF